MTNKSTSSGNTNFFHPLLWALKYAYLTTKHKVFVFIAGLKVGAPIWLLLIHDLSKYGAEEILDYGRQFFGDQGDPLGFSYAWLHHQRTNKHHWEAWIPITGHNRGGYKDMEPLPMPERYAREMVADFMGASRAYDGKWPKAGEWKWYEQNFHKVKLHPETRSFVVDLIEKTLCQTVRLASSGCEKGMVKHSLEKKAPVSGGLDVLEEETYL